jgi:hypothetical protein
VKSHAALLPLEFGGDDMTFSNLSYFAGVGTAFAAIALGFAGGAMLTTSAVQPPNRLERLNSEAKNEAKTSEAKNSEAKNPGVVNAGATSASNTQAATSGPAEQSSATTQPAQQQPRTVAAAPSAPAADSQTTQPPQPAAAVKTDTAKTDAATNVQQQFAPPVAKSDDASAARNDRAASRSTDSNRDATRSTDQNNTNRDAYRKRPDERKFSDRRRRQDQDQREQRQDVGRQDLARQDPGRDLDGPANVVRQMRRGGPPDEVAIQDEGPRFGGRPRRYELYGDDDDAPRIVREPPPRFGLFGD